MMTTYCLKFIFNRNKYISNHAKWVCIIIASKKVLVSYLSNMWPHNPSCFLTQWHSQLSHLSALDLVLQSSPSQYFWSSGHQCLTPQYLYFLYVHVLICRFILSSESIWHITVTCFHLKNAWPLCGDTFR